MWINGRQENINYFKLPLWKFKIWKFGFDGYILHYPSEGILPPHKDPIDGKHYRVNVTLKGKSEFVCEKEILNLGWLHFFRPDLYTHSLKIKTNSYKLSLGFAKLC